MANCVFFNVKIHSDYLSKWSHNLLLFLSLSKISTALSKRACIPQYLFNTCFCLCQLFVPFCCQAYSIVWMHHDLFIHSPVGRLLGSLHISANRNKVAVIIHIHVCFGGYIFMFHLDDCLEHKHLYSKCILIL